jgi:hypothetical protein
MFSLAQDAVRVARTGDKTKTFSVLQVPTEKVVAQIGQRANSGLVPGTVREISVPQSVKNAVIARRALRSPPGMVSGFVHVSTMAYFFA